MAPGGHVHGRQHEKWQWKKDTRLWTLGLGYYDTMRLMRHCVFRILRPSATGVTATLARAEDIVLA